ncbi:MAG: hypothetical protein MRZ54_13275 [Clostridiales bacterium]|nr:hypothetical protein [Clostridiales bacterium]
MTIQEAYRLYSKIEQEYNTIKEKHDFSVDGRNKAEWRAEKYLKKTPYYDKHLHELVFPITDTLQIASSIRETSSTLYGRMCYEISVHSIPHPNTEGIRVVSGNSQKYLYAKKTFFNRFIRFLKPDDKIFIFGKLTFDLEESFDELTGVILARLDRFIIKKSGSLRK